MKARTLIPGQLAIVALASAIAIPAAAQQAQPAPPQDNPPSAAQSQPATTPQASSASQTSQQQPSPDANQQRLSNKSKEGFWGHMQPFARKKWVKRQTDPINDRLTELDELNAKNAKDIQDVDSRAQAGIKQAQSTADAANQAATQAGAQAQTASTTAQGASGHVDQINTKVNGLDQYRQVSEVEVPFRNGSTVLSKDAKDQLDQLIQNVNGRQGYIIEMEAHTPGRGSVGIQNSQRIAQVVNRYLAEHDIPVYRMHAVALGNAQVASNTGADEPAAPVRKSSVHVRLMENSLAAQGAASPQGAAPSTGAERP
ncbi:OmpA family protein [Occallatibacter riparius]|uniref:OmpA family protein n=1 Tax=Occallatibacter riparius TaxID=1002689 RepID=A0A9J7BHX9_9BACT|nr:OmpA family protein [Occallatibacter riparius]UWZ82548.1 OmpA family protein [Occallatibacter riparius]